MVSHAEDRQMEYAALMDRGRDAERTGQLCWVAAGVAAAVLLSWGIGARNPGLMIPVVLAVALGFYAALRGRQQARLIAGYVEEFLEGEGGEPRWFTRSRQIQALPGMGPAGDWLNACLANAVIVVAVAFAWIFAAPAARGELMAGIVTGCAVGFAFHSISETSRLTRTDDAALWRQVSGRLREEKRPARAAAQ